MSLDLEEAKLYDQECFEYVKKFTHWPNRDGIRGKTGPYFKDELFIERANRTIRLNYSYRLPYTLRLHDQVELHNGVQHTYKSLYNIYMNSIDEYQFAMRAFNSFHQFKLLTECDWFMNGQPEKFFYGLRTWREEKDYRDKSLNLQRIIQHAEIGNIQSIKLLEERYRDARPKGRPNKEDKERQNKEHQETITAIKDIKLKLIKSNAA